MFLKELKLNHRKLGFPMIIYVQCWNSSLHPILMKYGCVTVIKSIWYYDYTYCCSGMCCVFHILSSLKIKHWCDCCYRLPWPSQKSWHLSCRVPRSGRRHHRSYGICDQFYEHATPCWQSMHILGPDFEQEWYIFWKRNLENRNEIHKN